MQDYPKVLLIVLDGFGEGKSYPYNAIKNARMPFYKEIRNKFPHAQIITCGEEVGLPAGVMGNSEVGHTNMGAGRIVYQELTKINRDIRSGDFQRNKEILKTIDETKKAGGRLHFFGLLSDAGVHSHIDHLKTLIEIASDKVPVTIHIITDGRDTPPTSSLGYLKNLGEFLKKFPHANIGSVSGRYYAMDRDNRWDRVELAYKAIASKGNSIHPLQSENGTESALKIIQESHSKNVTDEFIIPTQIKTKNERTSIEDGDSILFYNFRADRAREITRAFTEKGFKEFKIDHAPLLTRFLCLTQYDKNFSLPVAYPPQSLKNILPDIFNDLNLKQFRIAETEKYAHVTFFFNGGREKVYNGETRSLVPSPKNVPTYDLKPEMSAPEVTKNLVDALNRAEYHFVLVNYANPDMIGHTGNYEAAVKAMETVDDCLNKTISAAMKNGYSVIITADHGNCEEMRDENDQPHTQHTLNPVPIHFLSNHFKYKVRDGILADLAPTILQIMNLPQPKEMSGQSLLIGSRE